MSAIEPLPIPPDEMPDDALEAWVESEDADAPAPAVDASLGLRIARRRARVEARRSERRATVDAEIKRLQLWSQTEDYRDAREAARLDQLLCSILWTERQHDPRRKTLTLPYGVTVAARVQSPEWKRDEKALLEWAQANAPEYVAAKPVLQWPEMKKAAHVTDDGRAVLPDGQPLPGVQVVERGESVTVTVRAEGDG